MTAPPGVWTRRIALSGGLFTVLLTGAAPAHADPAPPFSELVARDASAPRLLESEADIRRAEGLAEQARAAQPDRQPVRREFRGHLLSL